MNRIPKDNSARARVRAAAKCCAFCGRVVKTYHVHHAVPVGEGGPQGDEATLTALCPACHSLAHWRRRCVALKPRTQQQEKAPPLGPEWVDCRVPVEKAGIYVMYYPTHGDVWLEPWWTGGSAFPEIYGGRSGKSIPDGATHSTWLQDLISGTVNLRKPNSRSDDEDPIYRLAVPLAPDIDVSIFSEMYPDDPNYFVDFVSERVSQ